MKNNISISNKRMFRNGGRPIHKFIHKHVPLPQAQVKWKLHDKQTYPPQQQAGGRWEVFAQTQFSVQPKSTYSLSLGIGVELVRGVCSVSLRQKLKESRCSLHDSFIAESVDSIIVTIQNNSDDDKVSIAAGASLCYVTHQSA